MVSCGFACFGVVSPTWFRVGVVGRGAKLGGAAGALAPPIILDFTK